MQSQLRERQEVSGEAPHPDSRAKGKSESAWRRWQATHWVMKNGEELNQWKWKERLSEAAWIAGAKRAADTHRTLGMDRGLVQPSEGESRSDQSMKPLSHMLRSLDPTLKTVGLSSKGFKRRWLLRFAFWKTKWRMDSQGPRWESRRAWRKRGQ